jgi:hypothetical protein
MQHVVATVIAGQSEYEDRLWTLLSVHDRHFGRGPWDYVDALGRMVVAGADVMVGDVGDVRGYRVIVPPDRYDAFLNRLHILLEAAALPYAASS